MASDVASLPTALPTRASNCSAGTSTRARPASPAASRILLPDVYALYGATLPATRSNASAGRTHRITTNHPERKRIRTSHRQGRNAKRVHIEKGNTEV